MEHETFLCSRIRRATFIASTLSGIPGDGTARHHSASPAPRWTFCAGRREFIVVAVLFWDGCHLFPKGYQIVANLVANAIRSLAP
jgi:lysophospholipase L1-like esterase